MKKWIFVLLFGCSLTQADMLDGLKAYEQKNYSQAQQQFQQLLPLGNELAAFNLGAMAYQGEGQKQDLIQALAYFMLAAELQHGQAKDVLASLVAKATEQQLDQANQYFLQLKRKIVILDTSLVKSETADLPKPIKRVAPKYPSAAAAKGLFGYVNVRFLVDAQGEITAIDTVDAYPQNTFERASIQAIKRWRYEPSGEKHILNVRLDYSLSGGVKVSAVEDVVNKHKLWDYALTGSPEHQFALGTLLSLADVQSGNSFWFNPELPLAAQADFSIYKNIATLRPDFSGFWGNAIVRVAADGTITEQIKADFDPKSELTNLVGLKFKGNVETDVYRIWRRPMSGTKQVIVTPSLQVSRSMSGMFWWEQAAKNGLLDAQRVMAAYHKQWEEYLLQQDDAEVMAWAGSKLILDGKREQGMQLLEQAIAKNSKPALEMKKQFM